jgi:stage III sporulation protein AB
VNGTGLRLAAAALSLAVGAWWGQRSAGQARAEGARLQDLALCLERLATEVGYAATPLPVALRRVGRAGGAASPFFLHASLALGTAASAQEAWEAALGQWTQKAPLDAEAKAVLMDLGAVVGRSDRQDQVAHLRRAARHLDRLAQWRWPELSRRAQLRQSLGLLGGLALAILVA